MKNVFMPADGSRPVGSNDSGYAAYNDPRSYYTDDELLAEAQTEAAKIKDGQVIRDPKGFYQVYNPHTKSFAIAIVSALQCFIPPRQRQRRQHKDKRKEPRQR